MNFVALLLPVLLQLISLPHSTKSQIDLTSLLVGDKSDGIPWLQLLGFLTNFESSLDNLLETVPDEVCASHIRETVQAITEMRYWSLRMLDASTKLPSGMLAGNGQFLGNFDECVNLRNISTKKGTFHGQHCMVHLAYNDKSAPLADTKINLILLQEQLEHSEENVANSLLLEKLLTRITPVIAMCVPSTCNSENIEIFLNTMAENVGALFHAKVKKTDCHTLEWLPYESIDYFAIAVIIFFLGLAICSTIYDIWTKHSGRRKLSFLAFSVYSNGKRLFEISKNRDSLQCLHGIRYLSIVCIIMGHRYLTDSSKPVTNGKGISEFIANNNNGIIMSTTFSVDTFLVLSGLLLSYVFFNYTDNRKDVNFPAFYLHRYIRLTPLLAVMILLQMSIRDNLGTGPIWSKYHTNDCDSIWWEMLLYIKNYSSPLKCMTYTWYLSVDMQLFWLSPLLLVPLWKRPKLGRLLLLVSIFLSWAIAFWVAYEEELVSEITIGVPVAERTRATKTMFTTHMRFGPWLLGLALGYILHCDKMRKLTFQPNKLLITILQISAAILMIWTLISIRPYVQPDFVYDRFSASLYISTSKLLWGLSVCILIFLCVTGHGGIVNSLLSLGVWQPLSRLTYCMYMIHLNLQYYQDASTHTPQYFGHVTTFPTFLGDIIITTAIAIPFSLLFESPFIVLEKMLFMKDTNKQKHVENVMDNVCIAIDKEKNSLKNVKEEKVYN